MSTLVARAAWIVTRVSSDPDGPGWHRVLISCPCATITRAVPPELALADALELARAEHRLRAGAACPHRGRP
jgi:hypothetical protein